MSRYLSFVFMFVLSFNTQAVKVDDQAPNFMLPMLEGGNNLTLKQFQGKVVYLDFWASWCGPCRQSLPMMNDLRNSLKSKGFEVLAINLDEETDAAKAFLKQYPVQYPIVVDKSGKTPEMYAIPGMPTAYLIDRRGNVREVHTGFKESDMPRIERKIKELLRENP